MYKDDRYFMLEALKEAEKSKVRGDWPVGCVIVIDDEIVSRGNNKVYSDSNKILHAEIDAISKVSKLLSERGNEATMFITYEPCPMCLGAIILNHIKRVVCGTNIDKSGALEMLNILPKRFDNDKYKFDVTSGFLEKECKDIFVAGEPAKKLNL